MCLKPSALPGLPADKPKRSSSRRKSCRAFQARTTSFVRTALDWWSSIFEQPEVPFNADPLWDCAFLAKSVKQLLASCPSGVQEEVFAFQSIKKGLPDSCKCMESALLDGLVANIVGGSPPQLPEHYLQFVNRTVSALFPKGWDTAYEGYCRRSAPPLKGVLEYGRSLGGSLGRLKNHDGLDHADFLEVALFGRSHHRELKKLQGALQVVQSAGKPRPLTTFSADGTFLRPLHKTIYDRLSKQKWLSRGDVTAESLSRAGFQRGRGTLVSGDYASATDNLSIEVLEVALSAMMKNAVCVPPNIKEFAAAACRPHLFLSRDEFHSGSKSTVGELRKGQMMGSYLSFPFLCLQNFLAFKWSTRNVRGKIPVLINGDDILFQSSTDVANQWMETVKQIGLEVERTKTSVDTEYGSLNSTLFRWAGEKLYVVPTLRFGMLRPVEYPNSLGKSFSSFLQGIGGALRFRAARVFFQAHLGALLATTWSLPSLGFRGALAHRLARVFGLLEDRQLGSPPSAPSTHSVCLPSELISEVPLEFVDGQLEELSSCETASWKWSVGFSSTDREREAIRYALASTKFVEYGSPGLYAQAMIATDREFSFRWGGGGKLSRGNTPSRKDMLKPFLMWDAPKQSKRVFYRVVLECLQRTDSFNCPLPTYDEAMLDCGAVGVAQGGERCVADRHELEPVTEVPSEKGEVIPRLQ